MKQKNPFLTHLGELHVMTDKLTLDSDFARLAPVVTQYQLTQFSLFCAFTFHGNVIFEQPSSCSLS